ncbi:MAG TPA: hypothetical protein ENI44_03750 [Thermoplasmatales archaeon]|nr:hypothetical protein [Thermoplasmatales archaeon]
MFVFGVFTVIYFDGLSNTSAYTMDGDIDARTIAIIREVLNTSLFIHYNLYTIAIYKYNDQ